MGRLKSKARKKKLIKWGSVTGAPIWVSIKKFGLKRIRTRRIMVGKQRHWRRDSLKE
jgi:ribosomal protein L39E